MLAVHANARDHPHVHREALWCDPVKLPFASGGAGSNQDHWRTLAGRLASTVN